METIDKGTEALAIRERLPMWRALGMELAVGSPARRVAALRRITTSLVRSLPVTTLIEILGDPWHRIPPRRSPADGTLRQVLSWRHPVDGRAQLQVLVVDGGLDAMQWVIDGGACLPPRICGVSDYWASEDAAAAESLRLEAVAS